MHDSLNVSYKQSKNGKNKKKYVQKTKTNKRFIKKNVVEKSQRMNYCIESLPSAVDDAKMDLNYQSVLGGTQILR